MPSPLNAVAANIFWVLARSAKEIAFASSFPRLKRTCFAVESRALPSSLFSLILSNGRSSSGFFIEAGSFKIEEIQLTPAIISGILMRLSPSVSR